MISRVKIARENGIISECNILKVLHAPVSQAGSRLAAVQRNAERAGNVIDDGTRSTNEGVVDVIVMMMSASEEGGVRKAGGK